MLAVTLHSDIFYIIFFSNSLPFQQPHLYNKTIISQSTHLSTHIQQNRDQNIFERAGREHLQTFFEKRGLTT